jgi:P-type conjugative transfer protein TrbJ
MILGVLLLFVRGQAPAQFGAVWCVNCSTELTSIAQKIIHIQQLIQQVEMLKDLIRNSAHQKHAAFADVSMEISMLAQAAQFGNGLAYSMGGIDAAWKGRFPGYSRPSDYQLNYKRWSDTALDTIVGAMRTANMSFSHQNGSVQLIMQLRNFLGAADGRLQALNVMGQIADNQAEQMTQLRSIMMAQQQSAAAYQSYVIQRDASDVAGAAQFFGEVQPVGDGVAPKPFNPF